MTVLRDLWARVRYLFAYEPAVVAWALNGGVAVLAAWAFHLTSTQEAAVTTIVTAAAAIYTATTTRPADVPTIIGALVTVVTAAAAFGFHPPAQWIAIGTAVASIMLPLALRVNLTPLAAIKANQAPPVPVGFGPMPPIPPVPDPDGGPVEVRRLVRERPGWRRF